MKKHHKETFEKIPEVKQQRILNAAIQEFAAKGFQSANINIIAKNAEISIGSMYNYFESKEDLFLTVIDLGYRILERVLDDVDLQEGDVFDKLETLLRAAQKYSKEFPELNQIYLDLTSEGLSHLSGELSHTVESITARYYRSLITEAKQLGQVAHDIDENIASFCIDNILLLFQYSFTSKYFNERMKIFVGETALTDNERMIDHIMKFIRRALSPR